MSKSDGLFTRAIPATRLVTQFKEFATATELSIKSQHVAFNISGVTCKAFSDAIDLAKSHPSLQVKDMSVSFVGPRNQGTSISVVRHDALSYCITIDNLQHLGEQRFNVLSALDTSMDVVDASEIIHDTLPETIQRQLAYGHTAVSELQTQTAQLGRYFADAAQRNDEFIQKITADAEAWKRSQEEELQRRVEDTERELHERQTQLDIREKELDRGEHRGVRRETLDKINSAVEKQKAFTLSSSAKAQAGLVHYTAICALIAGGTLAAFAAQAILGEGTATSSLAYVPFASGTILFGSTLVFYLRWLSGRFRQHADAEFANLSFSKDILRASWIAEFLLEAHNPTVEGQQPFDVPEFLIEKLSTGLFENQESAGSGHPIEDLQRYAKRFKKLSVGPVSIETKESETRENG